jgi:ABC-2 type transporter
LTTFLLLMLIAGAGLAIGLLMSAFANTSEMAIGLVPILMVVLGGAMLLTQKMQAPVRMRAYCLPLRSGFEALLISESNRHPRGPSAFSANLESADDAAANDRPDMAEGHFPHARRVGIARSAALLVSMLVMLVVAIHLTLFLRDIR